MSWKRKSRATAGMTPEERKRYFAKMTASSSFNYNLATLAKQGNEKAYTVYDEVPTELKALFLTNEVRAVCALLHEGGKDLLLATMFMEALSFGWGPAEEEIRELNTIRSLEAQVPGGFFQTFRDHLRQDFSAPGYDLQPRHFQLMSQMMPCCPKLQRIVIQSAKMGDPACEQFSWSLHKCPNLYEIRLEGCEIGSRGAASLIGEICTVAPWVNELSLDDNLISDRANEEQRRDCALMVTHLEKNPAACRRLCLNGNYLSDDALEAFKKVFSKVQPRRLDHLSVRWKQKKGNIAPSQTEIPIETVHMTKSRGKGFVARPRRVEDFYPF